MENNNNMAKLMVGPAFEELNSNELMELDGEWATPISVAISASSGWCALSAGVSIITYCATH